MKSPWFFVKVLCIVLLSVGSFAVNTGQVISTALNGVIGSTSNSTVDTVFLNDEWSPINDSIEYRQNEKLPPPTKKTKGPKYKFRCAVKTCRSRGNKGFYQIPENPVRRKEWLDAMKVTEAKSSAHICFRHFSLDQFRNPIFINTIDENRSIFGPLKKNAVPNQSLPGDTFFVDPNQEINSNNQETDSNIVNEIEIESQDPPKAKKPKKPKKLFVHDNLKNEHRYTPKTFDPYERIKKLERQLQLQKNKNKALMAGKFSDKVQREIVNNRLKHKFTPAQIHVMLSKKKLARCYKYEDEDFKRIYRLRALSPKCMKILKNDLHFPSPGKSTVDQKFSFFHIPLGIIVPCLELLKLKAKTMTEREKNCGICFDEIFIDNVGQIDQKLDQVIGPAKYANVLFVRSYSGDLKYPFFWQLDDQLSKEQFMTIIIALEDQVGLKIHSSTCDQGKA